MTKAKWPTAWLMTDERMESALWTALDRLPSAGGIVFRHYRAPDRDALALRVAEAARARGLSLAVARDVALARRLGAALVHNPAGDSGALAVSRSVHSLDEADRANAEGAALAFVSPIFPTRSHPDRPPLDPEQARAIVDRLDCPAIALGGMSEERFRAVAGQGFQGWAGIDAWIRT